MRNIRKTSIRLGLMAALLASTPLAADDARLAALEARIAELEARLAESEAKPATIPEPPEQAIEAEPQTDPSWQFGGYVKTDLMASRSSGGSMPAGSIGRDFFIPGTIPVGGQNSSTQFDAHARETRVFARKAFPTADGEAVQLHLEMDFLATPGGDERVSNSYSPRLRQAWLSYRGLLAGQTWSNFQNVGALPETVDFIGPAGATVFVRQAQLRYTQGGLSLAIENPESTITPNGGGPRIVSDDNSLPDLTARYALSTDFGEIQLAGLLRQLKLRNPDSGVDASTTGWGMSLSGRVDIGQDDLRWMITHGDGLGRYLGINLADGAVIDDQGRLQSIRSTAAFAGYRHWWTPQWRSSLVLGYTDVDAETRFSGVAITDSAFSGHLNLMYSPVESMSFGLEYIHARRKLADGRSGELDRLQFGARFGF